MEETAQIGDDSPALVALLEHLVVLLPDVAAQALGDRDQRGARLQRVPCRLFGRPLPGMGPLLGVMALVEAERLLQATGQAGVQFGRLDIIKGELRPELLAQLGPRLLGRLEFGEEPP